MNLSISSLVTLSLLPLVTGFGSIGNTHHAVKTISTVRAPKSFPASSVVSPLFVASTQNPENQTESPVIKSLDAEMQKAKKQLGKYQQKLSTYENKLLELEQKKNNYLQGAKLGVVDNNFSETTARSAVKAMMWRVIAGSVTFVTTLKFSGSLAVALKVVTSDFFSKAFTMFIGERLMNKNQSGRKSGADSAGRSVAKALVWRLFAICNTMAASLFFGGGDLKMASKIAGSDAIFKTGLMVAYERVWAKIDWGKEYFTDLVSSKGASSALFSRLILKISQSLGISSPITLMSSSSLAV